MTLLIIFLFICFAFEFASFIVYGFYAPKEIIEYILSKDKIDRVNMFNSSIVEIGNLTITNELCGITSHYHIQEGYRCRIPRWSKAHRHIKKLIIENELI